MKISKLSSLLCAAATATVCFTAWAEDTDTDNAAQAAARIALAKALFAEQATNTPAATNTAMHPVTDKEAQKQAKAKAKADKAAADAKAKQDAADAQAQAKMVEKEKSDADRAALATALTNNPPMADMSMASTTTKSATNSWASGPTAESQPAKKDKKSKKETASAASPAPMTNTNYIGGDLGMKRIAAPASPISASKDERLQALLQKYQADQITPEEYHQQRAAILAEP